MFNKLTDPMTKDVAMTVRSVCQIMGIVSSIGLMLSNTVLNDYAISEAVNKAVADYMMGEVEK